MTDNNYDIELYHHGVKGMKWGVRRKVQAAFSNYKKNRNTINRTAEKLLTKQRFSQDDLHFYGRRALSRATAKRMVNKGESFRVAQKKAKHRIVALSAITTAAATYATLRKQPFFSSMLRTSEKMVSTKVKDLGRSATTKLFNTEILDSNGNHMKFMNTTIRDFANANARR